MQKKIILADDNKTFLMYVGLLFKRLGFQLLPAVNGLDALRLAKTTPVDLITLDVHMDTLDGITALRHIKADKDIAHIPVIMISTDMSQETVRTCREIGCFDYLAKPIKVDMLHDAAQRAFFSQGKASRRHIRTVCNKKVSVHFKGIRYDLYAEMLSEGGLYVRKEDPLPIGADVDVILNLDDGRSRQLKGKVIYTKNQFGDFSTLSPGMAIQFVDLSEQDNRDMNNYVKTLVAGDILDEQGENILKL